MKPTSNFSSKISFLPTFRRLIGSHWWRWRFLRIFNIFRRHTRFGHTPTRQPATCHRATFLRQSASGHTLLSCPTTRGQLCQLGEQFTLGQLVEYLVGERSQWHIATHTLLFGGTNLHATQRRARQHISRAQESATRSAEAHLLHSSTTACTASGSTATTSTHANDAPDTTTTVTITL